MSYGHFGPVEIVSPRLSSMEQFLDNLGKESVKTFDVAIKEDDIMLDV